MVNPSELIDQDPAMEDILSVWGKDPTAQNLQRYFGVIESYNTDPLSSERIRNNHPFLQSTRKLEGNISFHQDTKGLQQTRRSVGNELHAGLL